jgi:hypothetical protein
VTRSFNTLTTGPRLVDWRLEARFVDGSCVIVQECDEGESKVIARDSELVSVPAPGTIDFSGLSRDQVELLLSEIITLAWGVPSPATEDPPGLLP